MKRRGGEEGRWGVKEGVGGARKTKGRGCSFSLEGMGGGGKN